MENSNNLILKKYVFLNNDLMKALIENNFNINEFKILFTILSQDLNSNTIILKKSDILGLINSKDLYSFIKKSLISKQIETYGFKFNPIVNIKLRENHYIFKVNENLKSFIGRENGIRVSLEDVMRLSSVEAIKLYLMIIQWAFLSKVSHLTKGSTYQYVLELNKKLRVFNKTSANKRYLKTLIIQGLKEIKKNSKDLIVLGIKQYRCIDKGLGFNIKFRVLPEIIDMREFRDSEDLENKEFRDDKIFRLAIEGFTQKKIAEEVGVSERTVRRILKKNSPLKS